MLYFILFYPLLFKNGLYYIIYIFKLKILAFFKRGLVYKVKNQVNKMNIV